MSSLPASTKQIGSKAIEKRWRHRFPHYKSRGTFCCHGNQNFDPICLKTLCSLSPTPVMLLIKFDQDWPTCFRDIQVWKFGRRQTTTTTTDGGPLVYYKLTLWAFGSGELKTKQYLHSILIHLARFHLNSSVFKQQYSSFSFEENHNICILQSTICTLIYNECKIKMSPRMTKPTKWAWAQPGHLPSLIRVFAVCSLGS